MPGKARTIVLTESQAACLIALRHHPDTKTGVAIAAKVTITKAAAALSILKNLRLADKDQTNSWFPTPRGKGCCIDTVPERRQESELPGPGGQRLLDLLQQPIRGAEIAKRLCITRQRVRQLLLKLHAQGLVRFLHPRDPLWAVARADDETHTLNRDELRVLQVMPREYATTLTKIRLAGGQIARMHRQRSPQPLNCGRFCRRLPWIEGTARLSHDRRELEPSPTRQRCPFGAGTTPAG